MKLNEIEMMSDISKTDQTFQSLQMDWRERFPSGRKHIIGSFGNFRIGVLDGNQQTMIAAYDIKANRFAAFIQMQHFHGGAPNIYEELVIGATKQYRGMGLASKMYALFIQEDGAIVISDSSHSAGGRSVWVQLSNEPGIVIHGYNLDIKEVFQVDVEDWFNDDVYDEGLHQEVDDLERELAQLEFSPDENSEKREQEIQTELNGLYAQLEEVGNTRLFAASK